MGFLAFLILNMFAAILLPSGLPAVPAIPVEPTRWGRLGVACAHRGFSLIYLRGLSGYVWFIFSDGRAVGDPPAFYLANILTRPLIGPLLMHFFDVTERDRLPKHWLWPFAIPITWILVLPISVLWSLSFLSVSRRKWCRRPERRFASSAPLLRQVLSARLPVPPRSAAAALQPV